ncbi:MAG TPA: hypothetical protein VKU41_33150 [Polyangiaceae bacterium]|nr:hypothetical protein [Polyangiaceae bacterium]
MSAMGQSAPPAGGRTWARDALGAAVLVESAVAQRIFIADGAFAQAAGRGPAPSAKHNAFGEPLAFEYGHDVQDLARACAEAAAAGERVALFARATDLAAARNELARIAARRLGVVVHAVAEAASPGTPPALAGMAPVLSLDDLPWGMLLGAGVADAVDLAFVARRAAEDSGCPFFVVHERLLAHHVEPVAPPSRALCEAFVGPSQPERRPSQAPSPGSDRTFAERVPFALASAMREIEGLTGRRHDVVEKAPTADSAVVFVGAGALGESLVSDVERLRAAGHDVGAVRVVAWRPFPAARVVKAIGRALAVTVLERVDQPLASNPPLAGQIKAAFADAITWAPDYPGIGRVPRIVSGVLAAHREIDPADLDAAVHNVLADERGKRTFLLGGEEAHSLSTPVVARTAGRMLAVRGVTSRREVAAASAELCAGVLASALGLRTRVAVRALPAEEGSGVAFDLLAGRERPLGAHVPHAVHAVVLEDGAQLAQGNPLARIASAGVVVFPTHQRAAEALWGEVPPWAKALVFDRRARLLGWVPPAASEQPWMAAAAFAGVILAVAAAYARTDPGATSERAIEASLVEREVSEALRVALEGSVDLARVAAEGGAAARRAFEGSLEVPRATIERDDDSVRLGRRDARLNPGA